MRTCSPFKSVWVVEVSEGVVVVLCVVDEVVVEVAEVVVVEVTRLVVEVVVDDAVTQSQTSKQRGDSSQT